MKIKKLLLSFLLLFSINLYSQCVETIINGTSTITIVYDLQSSGTNQYVFNYTVTFSGSLSSVQFTKLVINCSGNGFGCNNLQISMTGFNFNSNTSGNATLNSTTAFSNCYNPGNCTSILKYTINNGWIVYGTTVCYGMSPLPIELLNFNALNINNNNILITWGTITETNNKSFILYNSIDGINFKEINIQNGAGNSLINKKYSYLDTININNNQISTILYMPIGNKEIYNSLGILIDITDKTQLNVNNYDNGVYYLIMNNIMYKFMVFK